MLNEVIEHVRDDAATLRGGAARASGPGGHIVIYAPNRLYPFETHGIYLGKRFVFGNIPFINWLPDPLRNRLVPHARAYTKAGHPPHVPEPSSARERRDVCVPGLRQHHRAPQVARRVLLRSALYRAERTPLRVFGLSHFVVLEKLPARMTRPPGDRER